MASVTAGHPSAVTSVTASAPGKIILFGEHAVVYGVPALAASLSSMRIHVTATRIDTPKVTVQLDSMDGFKIEIQESDLITARGFVGSDFRGVMTPCLEVTNNLVSAITSILDATDASHGVKKALTSLLYIYIHMTPKLQGEAYKGMKFHVESKGLPVGAGLGSSAAFSVALCTALTEIMLGPSKARVACSLGRDNLICHRPDEARLNLINDWAFLSEKLLHGTPSGLDNTTSTFGGAIAYVKEPRKIERLKTFPELKLLLTNTQVPRETSILVGNVRVLRSKHPSVIKSIFDGIKCITDECLLEIEKWSNSNDLEKDEVLFAQLASLVNINQGLLVSIGVSHPTLDTICRLTAEMGLSSKLTGAGGGGCAFTLLGSGKYSAIRCKDGEEDLVTSFCSQLQEEHGFVSFESLAGGLGAVVHTY